MDVKHPQVEARALTAYGCDAETVRSLDIQYTAIFRPAPSKQYLMQRRNASRRCIAWEFTFHEWMLTWLESGHAGERGRGAQNYVMARKNDAGPYSPENVYITCNAQNVRDSYRFRRDKGVPINAHCPKSKPGRGKGWTYVKRGKKNYWAHFQGRYIGAFMTAAEAEAAYQQRSVEWSLQHAA